MGIDYVFKKDRGRIRMIDRNYSTRNISKSYNDSILLEQLA
ncbi:hypothetical protein [Nitrosomonas europaea]|nr:hypothetical protein [Nitrosomonas europaea]HRN80853.1 hypothetical protein [Nitrosomonas europaea]HRO55175.1 hypothetical protein [Nitrosomonas europaea]HRQ07571.1 hypothetical protein [Nitrosomonas europaea]HUM72803.1 hypothetical protein [Nitrosomonas europaea]